MPDFMEKLIDVYRAGKLTFNQLDGNSRIIMGAGSETTATLLSGKSFLVLPPCLSLRPSISQWGDMPMLRPNPEVTFFLCQNPRILEKLTKEIRGLFKSPEDITMTSVNSCPYLLACLEEALRIRPPSPAIHPRYTPAEGAMVDGHHIPGEMAVGIPIYAASMSPLNFRDPEKFIPERWTGEDPAYADDKKEALQAFSFGPRNCIGRNLAYLEMKLLMARLVWHFDLEACFDETWLNHPVFMIWDKPPLMLKLKPASRD